MTKTYSAAVAPHDAAEYTNFPQFHSFRSFPFLSRSVKAWLIAATFPKSKDKKTKVYLKTTKQSSGKTTT